MTQRANLFNEDASSESIPLSSADEEIQEALMIEDLLFVLMGIEGQYIHFSEDYDPENPAKRLRGPDFIIDPDLNVPMKHSLERILPMAKSYISINAFVEMDSSLEYGTVTHALCAAIRDLLKVSIDSSSECQMVKFLSLDTSSFSMMTNFSTFLLFF